MSWPVLPLGLLGSQASTSDNDTYQVSRSLRFNSADSAYLSRTPSSAGNLKTWTWSGWVKKANSGTAIFISADPNSGNRATSFYTRSLTDGRLEFEYFNGTTTYNLTAADLLRDPSSYYHLIIAVDTTQTTNTNRTKIYKNGVQLTLSGTYVPQNTDMDINNNVRHNLGRFQNASAGASGYFGGYLTEIHFIDGQALTPASFGETDAITGRWKAKAYSGTTYKRYAATESMLSQSGLGSYTAPFVVDNNIITTAFHSDSAGIGSFLQFDLGAGVTKNFRKIRIQGWKITSAGPKATWNVQYSDNGSSWTNVATGINMDTIGSNTYGSGTGYFNAGATWGDAGAHRYWRIYKTNAAAGGDYHTGVDFYEIDVAGNSYGTNGFYLPFSNNGGNTPYQLGADNSGNENDWTPNNLSVTPGTGNDSLTDSPSNYGTISTTLVNDTYQISRSLRFNSADSAYLSRTPASASNRTTWTWSGWVKRSSFGGAHILMEGGSQGTTDSAFYFDSNDNLDFFNRITTSVLGRRITSQVFRDVGSWFHLVVVWDSANATASERIRIYVNGSQITSFSSQTNPGPSELSSINNTVLQKIGATGASTPTGGYFGGYLAEVHFIDGQALTPSSFGTRDINTYLWKPKAYTGTYGTNGFYLPFSNTSTGSNSVLFSEDFSAAMYTKDASSVTTNTTTAPNGATTADTFTENSATATHRFYFNNLTYTNGVTFTSSIYVKANTRSAVNLENWNGTVANNCYADLSNGTIISGSHASSTITSVGNGWYRISVSNVGTGGAACGSALYIKDNATAGFLSYAGNGTGSIFIWGMQTEASSTVGPYLATNGTAIGSTLLLGADASVSTGGYNNWVANNFSVTAGVGNDSLVDSPTYYGTDNGAGGEVRGSYCTLNPNSTTTGTFSNGNLRFVGPSNPWARANGTISVSSGKWYYEVTLANAPFSPRSSNSGWNGFGFGLSSVSNSSIGANSATDAVLLTDSGYLNNFSGSLADVGASASGDVLSVAVDLDANTFTFRRNNIQISTGTIGGTPGRSLVPCIVSYDAQYGVMDVNFGQRPFAHAAPSGFKALRDYNKLPVPTGGEVRGNYATLNPLFGNTGGTITDGNLKLTHTGGANGKNALGVSSVAVSSGKWYGEVTSITANQASRFGIFSTANTTLLTSANPYLGTAVDGYSAFAGGGTFKENNSITTAITNFGASAPAAGDVYMVALDMDNNKVWFGRNGSWANGGNPATGTVETFSILSGRSYYFACNNYTDTQVANFGQRPWAYDAPFGFLPLCTTLLPQPIVQKSSTAMDVVTYTGDGTARTVSLPSAFSPDLVWLKSRNNATWHMLADTVRGANKHLSSNNTDTEYTDAAGIGFASNGFTLGADTADAYFGWNINTNTYVAWAWDAGSSSVSNTSGSITSTVRANPQAGVSVVSFVNASGTNQSTVGHGLGSSPKMIIAKNRDTGANNWAVFHSSVCDTTSKFLQLNTTSALATFATVWGASLPSSSVFGVTGGGIAAASVNIIAYCFAEVEGFSKFGSYTGNGSADGPFVFCGFRPRWVMVKKSSSTGSWAILDTAINTFNAANTTLYSDLSNAENSSFESRDYLSNGFKLRTTDQNSNQTGQTFIFAAFAEAPFKYARAR